MRHLLALSSIIAVSLLLSSCCNQACPDCYKLDEENCECTPQVSCLCSNGILDEGEEDIDCGGKCAPCVECLSQWCVLLSGGTSDQDPKTSKKWILIGWDPLELTATFSSDGSLYETLDDPDRPDWTGIATGSWAFDDPVDPIGKSLYLYYNSSPPGWSNPYTWTIVQLTADTLKVDDETGSLMILIPDS